MFSVVDITVRGTHPYHIVLLNIHSHEKQDGGQAGVGDLTPHCYPEILLRTIEYKVFDCSCAQEMTWLDMTIWMDGKRYVETRECLTWYILSDSLRWALWI